MQYYCVVGIPARAVAKVCGINKDTACTWCHRFRTIIATHLQKDISLLDGEVEADAHEVSACPYLKKYSHAYVILVEKEKAKDKGGAAGKTAVFGLYKRNKYVYTVSIDNTKSPTLILIINTRVKPDSIVYTDQYKIYDTLRYFTLPS